MQPTKEFSLPFGFSLHTTSFFAEHITSLFFRCIYSKSAYTPSNGVHSHSLPRYFLVGSTHRLARLQSATACTKFQSPSSYATRLCLHLSAPFQTQLARDHAFTQRIDPTVARQTRITLSRHYHFKIFLIQCQNQLFALRSTRGPTQMYQTFYHLQKKFRTFLPGLPLLLRFHHSCHHLRDQGAMMITPGDQM